ncbi:hypothetical protein [Ornithinimicrobium cavernae]|uniref:hypothetical protein n=1 Tax=Ornithinimicrobium cavernae TaxID=2666047 RepID=UPI0012B16520|nr:hypothetical protein [Ornithinimicrobium cavernae]
MTHVLLQGAEVVHHGKELPFNPIWYGVITIVIALALLGLLWSFRNSLALDPVAHHHDDLGSGAPDGRPGSHH